MATKQNRDEIVTRKKKQQLRLLTHHDIGRFYTRGRIMRLDELGKTFVIRLVIRL